MGSPAALQAQNLHCPLWVSAGASGQLAQVHLDGVAQTIV